MPSPSLGLMGMTIPEEVLAARAATRSPMRSPWKSCTRIDSSVAITLAAHHSLGTLPIYLFGTEEQRREWLPDLAAGRRLASFGLTEPEAGPDAVARSAPARGWRRASG